MRKIIIAALALAALVAGAGAVYASSVYSGQVTGTAIVIATSTTSDGPVVAMTSATANGASCTIQSNTTASCPSFNVDQGQTSAFTATFCNYGTTAVALSVSASASLQGSTIVPTAPALVLFAGGCNTESLTYTASGTSIGTDSIKIGFSA